MVIQKTTVMRDGDQMPANSSPETFSENTEPSCVRDDEFPNQEQAELSDNEELVIKNSTGYCQDIAEYPKWVDGRHGIKD